MCPTNHQKYLFPSGCLGSAFNSPQGPPVWRDSWCRTIETDLQRSAFSFLKGICPTAVHTLQRGTPGRCLLCFQSLSPAWLLYKSLENVEKKFCHSLLVWGVLSSSPLTWWGFGFAEFWLHVLQEQYVPRRRRNWCVFPSPWCQPSSAEVGFLYLFGSKQSGRCTCAPELAAGHHLVRKQCQGDRSKHRCS